MMYRPSSETAWKLSESTGTMAKPGWRTSLVAILLLSAAAACGPQRGGTTTHSDDVGQDLLDDHESLSADLDKLDHSSLSDEGGRMADQQEDVVADAAHPPDTADFGDASLDDLLGDVPEVICLPSCTGKECGPDGCGGSCGACTPLQVCQGGNCACAPNCQGKQCGDDGCGGSCGTCSSGTCTGGHCNCVPDCTGKSCGDDGCGGFCGFCWPECTCQAGLCQGTVGNFQVPCNSTVIDPVSGLTWEMGTNLSVAFATAKTYCDELTLGGHDDWRLPTIDELRTLISGCPATMTGGACAIHDNCHDASCISSACNGCPAGQGPGENGLYLAAGLTTTLDTHYWSATTLTLPETPAFVVEFNTGKIGNAVTTVTWKAVRCVRK